jgi:hypothetical protein
MQFKNDLKISIYSGYQWFNPSILNLLPAGFVGDVTFNVGCVPGCGLRPNDILLKFQVAIILSSFSSKLGIDLDPGSRFYNMRREHA